MSRAPADGRRTRRGLNWPSARLRQHEGEVDANDLVATDATHARLVGAPDLVLGAPNAMGDVKYKLAGGDWDRADLYQVIAFAAAFRVTEALIIRFRTSDRSPLDDVLVGDIRVRELTWVADAQEQAGSSAAALARDVETWLGSIATPSREVKFAA